MKKSKISLETKHTATIDVKIKLGKQCLKIAKICIRRMKNFDNITTFEYLKEQGKQ